ncbi:MAG: hypothetical protein R3B68_00910 [Phycisphaerales bacterium]
MWQVSIAAIASFCWASAALAQTAALRITHEAPGGIVQPGQTIAVTATLTWTEPMLFWRIEGDLTASPNSGAAANNAFGHPVTPAANTILDPGVPSGGSVLGVEVQSGVVPLFGPPYPAPWWPGAAGLRVLEFEWTAPLDPGPVEFNWIEQGNSGPTFFIGLNPNAQTVPTTYVGATLTVVPAPSAGLALAAAGVAATGRRRRPSA